MSKKKEEKKSTKTITMFFDDDGKYERSIFNGGAEFIRKITLIKAINIVIRELRQQRVENRNIFKKEVTNV